MDEYVKECYIKAGRIAAETKTFARHLIKKDMKLIDIALAIDKKILEQGAVPAFPVNLSINDIAAHFTPTMDCEELVHGILKIDIGVAIDGYIADTAFTLDFTEDQEHSNMINLNRTIQENIINTLTSQSLVKDVGETVHKTLEAWNTKHQTNYSIIRSLSGHQVAQNIIHAGVTISNYPNENRTPLKGKACAIEPFVTTGDGDIFEGAGGGIYGLRTNDQPRDKDARILLAYIKEHYKTRPFCSRWPEQAGLKKVNYCLKLLEQQGIIHHYPLLIEKSRHPVSQFENTFLFLEDNVIVTTKE